MSHFRLKPRGWRPDEAAVARCDLCDDDGGQWPAPAPQLRSEGWPPGLELLRLQADTARPNLCARQAEVGH